MPVSTKIAFYAPLKPPDHPIPSGDRQMARMLFSALNTAGFEVDLASRYISYSKRHGEEYFNLRRDGALKEAERLVSEWKTAGNLPDLWFCYHPYDKSPDWLGMKVCQQLDIPMITAEPCKTGQGPNGEWVPWRKEAQKGIAMADMNIVMTRSDREYLKTFVPDNKVVWMPPFIENKLLEPDDNYNAPAQWPIENSVKLLTVGMMRPGAKMDSYTVLAEALKLVKNSNWSLVLAGGGPGEEQVRELFNWAGDRVRIIGEKSPQEIISLMQSANILAWPGCREAYGMVYLEAASFGVPAAGLDNMGVPLVVENERTGLLANPPDHKTYAEKLDRLISNENLREKLSDNARQFALVERSGSAAAERLKSIIDGVISSRG